MFAGYGGSPAARGPEPNSNRIATDGPVLLMDTSNCGALRLSRTRCFSSGVVDAGTSFEPGGEASYILFWLIEGRMDLVQGMGSSSLLPADMALCDAARPLACWVRADRDCFERVIMADWLTVRIPRSLLTCGELITDEPSATHLSGRSGTGRILLDVLRAFLEESPRIEDSARVRLSGILLDLLAVVLSERIEQPARPPADRRDSSTLQRIQHFVEVNLSASELTPSYLAEVHHISVRQLHKLFQKRGLTVSSWIRERRLEGWRRELVDPRNDHRSVHALARNWGLRNSAHANRLFREMYGITPAAYRRRMSPG